MVFYNENIPQAPDNPSSSQGLMLDNFMEINTAFNLNHGNFNGPDQGLHKFMVMPQQDSAPATADLQGALYAKDVSSKTDLFYRGKSDGTELQITNAFLAADTGNIIIPGGIRLSWGMVTINSPQSAEIAPANIANIFNIQISVNGDTSGIYAFTRVGQDKFKVIRVGGGANINVHWLVIGL